MKIKITEIEADARELRESNTLAGNFANLLTRCFQSTEPFDDEDDGGDESDEERSRGNGLDREGRAHERGGAD